MSKKSFVITFIFLVFVSIVVLAAIEFFRDKEPKLSDDEYIIKAITESNSEFIHNNKPVIEIDSITVFNDHWYVATIKSLRATENIVPVKVVVLDTDGIFKVIAGPDTHFTEAELLRYNMPDSVILELQK